MDKLNSILSIEMLYKTTNEDREFLICYNVLDDKIFIDEISDYDILDRQDIDKKELLHILRDITSRDDFKVLELYINEIKLI